MIVSLNGTCRTIPQGATVRDVLEMMGSPDRGVAVALNEQVVPSSRWSSTTVHDRDRLEILTAAQGG